MSLFAYCICNSMRGTRDRVHILLIGLSKEHVLLYFSISSFIVRQPNLVVSRGDVTLYHVLHIIRRVYSLNGVTLHGRCADRTTVMPRALLSLLVNVLKPRADTHKKDSRCSPLNSSQRHQSVSHLTSVNTVAASINGKAIFKDCDALCCFYHLVWQYSESDDRMGVCVTAKLEKDDKYMSSTRRDHVSFSLSLWLWLLSVWDA